MSRFVRDSKVRHVFCQPPKAENCYSGMRLSTSTGDGNYVKGNAKWLAVALQGGGGPVMVLAHDQVGRVPLDVPTIQVRALPACVCCIVCVVTPV